MKTAQVLYFEYMSRTAQLREVDIKKELTIEGYKCILHKEPERIKSVWSVTLVDVGVRVCHSCKTQNEAIGLAERQIKTQLVLMPKAIETAMSNLKKFGFPYPLN